MIPSDLYIWVVSPPGQRFVRVFDEIVLSLESAFRRLNRPLKVHRSPFPAEGTPIVIIGHFLAQVPPVELPKGSIIYNFEQVFKGSPLLNDVYMRAMREHQVWDYSLKNIDELRRMGIKDVKFVPLGYVPEIEVIPRMEEDFDVTFIGALNDRRRETLDMIDSRGLKLGFMFDVWGVQRDEVFARSKVVLNIHSVEAKIFQTPRVTYALANRRFVVSETGSDRDLERMFDGGLVWGSSPREIADACEKYVRDDAARREIAKRGQQIFRTMRYVDFIANAFD